MSAPSPLRRIVSGGQTGVDRAALDAALAIGFPCGGWCPRGRRAEDGAIAARYPLVETASRNYGARTRMNVRDSDATLILCSGPATGGTATTARAARALGRPLLTVDLAAPDFRALDPATGPDATLAEVAGWIAAQQVAVLNVAGPRESTAPGVYGLARPLIDRLLRTIAAPA